MLASRNGWGFHRFYTETLLAARCGRVLLGPGEQVQRVNRLPVEQDLVVQVCARRASGGAHVPDDVASLDLHPCVRGNPRHVPVARREAEAMLHSTTALP